MIEQEYGDLAYLQFTQLLPHPNVIHGIFTRQGGHSEGAFQSLNTSTLSGKDKHQTVVRNRTLTQQALGIHPQPCITLWQVHGGKVQIFNAQDEWRTDWVNNSYWERPWTPTSVRKGDALITQECGTALAFSFADCTPIIFHDPITQAIGIAHGGWRGTARGIVIATVEAMQEHFGSKPADILANIGPTIGACCYEISEQVREIFEGKRAFEDEPTPPHHRKLIGESAVFSIRQLDDRKSLRLDLQATNRNQLLMAGLLPEHIELADICTGCNRDRFFSHRKEQGNTGRFPVIIMLKEG